MLLTNINEVLKCQLKIEFMKKRRAKVTEFDQTKVCAEIAAIETAGKAQFLARVDEFYPVPEENREVDFSYAASLERLIPRNIEAKELFPNLSGLKFLKAQAGIYTLALYYNSQLLQQTRVRPNNPQESLKMQIKIDFEENVWKVLQQIFELGSIEEYKHNAQVSIDWWTGRDSFWNNYQTRYDENKLAVRWFKKTYPWLITKQDVVKKCREVLPSVRGLLSLLEHLIGQKRIGEVYLGFPKASSQLIGQRIFSSIKEYKDRIEDMAVTIETSLTNPEMENIDIGEYIINLVQLHRQKMAQITEGTLQLNDAIQLGEITDREIHAAVDSKADLEEFDQRMAKKKPERKEE